MRHQHDLTDSAHQLQRAARELQQRTSGPEAVAALPTALAHLEDALDLLATGVVKAAQSVEDWALESAPSPNPDVLCPEARALRWHLFHLSARLRSAQDACPDASRWASDLLRQPAVAGSETSAASGRSPGAATPGPDLASAGLHSRDV
jgi:hypothetical protein